LSNMKMEKDEKLYFISNQRSPDGDWTNSHEAGND